MSVDPLVSMIEINLPKEHLPTVAEQWYYPRGHNPQYFGHRTKKYNFVSVVVVLLVQRLEPLVRPAAESPSVENGIPV